MKSGKVKAGKVGTGEVEFDSEKVASESDNLNSGQPIPLLQVCDFCAGLQYS